MLTRIARDPEGLVIVESLQDVAPILERNRALRSLPQRSDWGRHVATIPNVLIVRWLNEEGADVLRMGAAEFGAFIRRKLDDPDWRHLRADK